jgi:regulator of replication initiation timing
MKTTEALIRLETQVQRLLEELQEVKMHVYALEEENERLRAKVFCKDTLEGRENLIKLYEEGFHICPMHFGGRRDTGDCLFCHAFLSKRAAADE